ncbi:F-box domain-containing protein [Hirschfeldia incana]|nr:F-box domain-containing protein [Hirschfeldia incana]
MDRISSLHDSLILRILENLPYNQVVSTGVLSKGWKGLWKKVNKVEVYLQRHHTRSKLEHCIIGSLTANTSCVVDTLRLHVAADVAEVAKYQQWLGLAVGRGLRVLEIDIMDKTNHCRIWIPPSFFLCETLVEMKLRNFCVTGLPLRVCLKSLKTLELDCVRFEDEASVSKLISGCPILEELVVCRACATDDDLEMVTFTVNVTVPSLLRLKIHGSDYWEEGYTTIYVMNTPSLKYLDIAGYEDFEVTFVQIPLELVEANTRGLGLGIGQQLLHSLSSVTRLALSSYRDRGRFDNTVFHRLVDLELSMLDSGWWDLLTRMINHSPALRILRLVGSVKCFIISFDVLPRTPKNAPLYLETLSWKCYRSTPQVKEKKVVNYLVRNANRLNRAATSSRYLSDSEEKVELLKELKSVVQTRV